MNPAPLFVGESTSASKESADADAKKYWRQRIEKVGDSEAYKELSRVLTGADISYQHVQAHIFGGALYEVRELSAIDVCDLEFSMGCYHEYLGSAVADRGMEVLAQLAQACASLPKVTQGGCFHGIGHGIQATLGYGPEDLQQAVGWCKKISVPYRYAGESCAAGLYMEYHFRTLSNPSAPLPRPLVEGNYFSPCDILPDNHLRTCVLYLPEWWMSLLYKPEYLVDDAPLYQKMGEICRALKLSEELTDTCFTALGITSVMDTDAPKIIQRCLSASHTQKEETLCRGAAAWQYRHNAASGASDVCKDLQGEMFEYCMTYASGEMKILHSIMVPAFNSLQNKQ